MTTSDFPALLNGGGKAERGDLEHRETAHGDDHQDPTENKSYEAVSCKASRKGSGGGLSIMVWIVGPSPYTWLERNR